MTSDAGSLRLKGLTAAIVAATAGLAMSGCTGDNPPENKVTPSAASTSAAGPSLTFEEAYRQLPMNGTKDLPIAWDLAGAPDTDEVLAARRSLAFIYWERSSTDWTPIIPIGRFVYTEKFYQEFLAPYATSSTDKPLVGPIWVKVMGVETSGPDQATVTFCTDLGYWHEAEQGSATVSKNRANLESYVVESVASGDGVRHWLTDRLIDNDGDRKAKYGAACTKWAQHKP